MSFDEITKDKKVIHRLYYLGILQVDFIPFGSIENGSGSISWPPEFAVQMRVLGFKDAWEQCLHLTIDKNVKIPIVSLVGLLLLKLLAWDDRHLDSPKKDAYDIALIIRNYADAGNLDRLYNDYQNIVEEEHFDLNLSGARLLGRDLKKIATQETVTNIIKILSREGDPSESEALASELALFIPDRKLETATLLIQKLRQGLESST